MIFFALQMCGILVREGAILMLVSIYSRGLTELSFGAIMMLVNIYLARLF